MRIDSVGIVGYGNFGAHVHAMMRRFVPDMPVRVYEPRKEADGTTFFPLEVVAQCDAVILAVPISAFEQALRSILPITREETVIVDVATVKMHTTKLLKKLAKGRRYIATHPMFGPESYGKRGGNIAGFRIVVAAHTLSSAQYAVLRSFVEDLGFVVVDMTPRAHDKQLAETLFLTQFIGQAVEKGGFRRTDIDTVSFGFLMDAVESVRADTKLFRDVFRFNPYCKKVLDRFEKSERSIRKLLEK